MTDRRVILISRAIRGIGRVIAERLLRAEYVLKWQVEPIQTRKK